jgi:hypothetical protein
MDARVKPAHDSNGGASPFFRSLRRPVICPDLAAGQRSNTHSNRL